MSRMQRFYLFWGKNSMQCPRLSRIISWNVRKGNTWILNFKQFQVPPSCTNPLSLLKFLPYYLRFHYFFLLIYFILHSRYKFSVLLDYIDFTLSYDLVLPWFHIFIWFCSSLLSRSCLGYVAKWTFFLRITLYRRTKYWRLLDLVATSLLTFLSDHNKAIPVSHDQLVDVYC